MARSRLLVVFAVGAVLVALAAVPALGEDGGASPIRRPATLPGVARARTVQEAIRAGVLDRRVLVELRRRGSVDALLILDGSSALEQAMASAPAGLE
ncbi:MAG TPA: hypothetical protein VJ259_07920, partial [Actinomycetota bacterium]|nr:hypothetical protein [Actinomycetota bacterium]